MIIKLIAMVALSLTAAMQPLIAQQDSPASAQAIARLVEEFKKDPRGPYEAIRWFCPDGSILPPKERCSKPGGIQHALAKPVVRKLAKEQGLHLGQILAGSDFQVFWNQDNVTAPFFQYQLEGYLQTRDNGWINRRARYYRGAIQAEDEIAWGDGFINWLTSRNEELEQYFFVIREAARNLPHSGSSESNRRWEAIRANALTIADSLVEFMDLRVKLHGQPDASDIGKVQQFRKMYARKITPSLGRIFNRLEQDLQDVYSSNSMQRLGSFLRRLPPNGPLKARLASFLEDPPDVTRRATMLSGMLWIVREQLPLTAASYRPAMLDFSVELENSLFQLTTDWQPKTIAALIDQFSILAMAAAGCGYLERWEWEAYSSGQLQGIGADSDISLREYMDSADAARRVVEWSAATIRAWYQPTVNRFATFEPLANSYIDERVRGSLLLLLGDVAARLRELSSQLAGLSNSVLNIPAQGQFQGMNPGFARGELVVVDGEETGIDFRPGKIYVLKHPPADLKPVAGILTVSQGNLVSHVQLLARNLGIPNAVLSPGNLVNLQPFSGRQVFMAVSPRGTVVIKLQSDMTAAETALFDIRRAPDKRLRVPVDRINLKKRSPVSLRALRAGDSGILVGPKAANLGELKHIFSTHVVEGFAIPFGIFRQHMNQPMSGTGKSYWEFLNGIFAEAAAGRSAGTNEAVVEDFVLQQLTILRNAIALMPFLSRFESQLDSAFLANFSAGPDQQPVFIRSDTNMEDLADFTGAGLNLTVFNVVGRQKLLQGIRDVWASPYSERSYRWRQKYLLNPENVYPSILILPSVNVDISGVMITTGVGRGNAADITLAFSRGAGGAVDGQAAESWLLRKEGNLLLSPARERQYNILPVSGGVKKGLTTFEMALLTPGQQEALRIMAETIKKRLAAKGKGPWDIELGFTAELLWLFQIRPFVENKYAHKSDYLQSLDPAPDARRKVPLGRPL